MSSQRRSIVAITLIVGISTAYMWVNAGTLNPPPGPIQPTMHNLEDIYNATVKCREPGWTCRYIDDTIAQTLRYQIAPPGTSGILHGYTADISVAGEGNVNDLANPIFGNGMNSSGGSIKALDIRFTNGLWVSFSQPNSQQGSVLYRLD